MAADLGKQNVLAIHLKKIAYGTAAAVGLIFLVVAVSLTSEVKDFRGKLEEAQALVRDRQVNDVPGLTPPPDLARTIQAQWAVEPLEGPWISAWSVDPRPAVVKLVKQGIDVAATHQAPSIVRVSYGRDKDRRKVFIKVEAARGESTKVKIEKARVFRAEIGEAGPGEFQEIGEIGDPMVHEDRDVAPGKKFAYKVSTEAVVDPAVKNAVLEEADKLKESEALGMKDPIPYDYAVEILNAVGPNLQSGTPAKLNGTAIFWDYASAKVVRTPKAAGWSEEDTFGPKGPDGKERYQIKQIEDGKISVLDRWDATLKRETLTPKDNRRPVGLPPEVTVASASPPPEEDPDEKPAPKASPKKDDQDGEAPAGKKAAPEKAKPKTGKTDKEKKPKRPTVK